MADTIETEKPGKLPPGEPDINLANDWPKSFGLVFAALRVYPLITVLVFLFSAFEAYMPAPLNSGIISYLLSICIVRQVIILTARQLGQDSADSAASQPWPRVAASVFKLGAMSIFYYVMSAVMTIAFVVPGLWAAGAFALTEAVFVLEGTSITDAFKRSRALTRNYITKVILYTALVPLVVSIVVTTCGGFIEQALLLTNVGTPHTVQFACRTFTAIMVTVVLFSVHVLVTRMYVRLSRGGQPILELSASSPSDQTS